MSSSGRRLLLLVDESPYLHEHEPMARRVDRTIDLLEKHGWRVIPVTIRTRWEWHTRLLREGREAYSLRCPSYSQVPFAALRLVRILRKTHIDVIHASGALAALISGLSRFLVPKPVRIYERHHYLGRPRLRVSSRLAGAWSDHTIACSEAVKRMAIEADRSSPSAVTVVHAAGERPRAVDSAEGKALRSRLGIGPSAAVIVLVARLRPEKGHVVLIEAMRILAGMTSMEAHAIFVGAGPYESAIHRTLREEDPFTLHMVGHQPDVAPWMAIGDVIAMPSLIEPFGKVAYEALAAGRPLVASRVGGLPEIVDHRKNGLLVRPNDPKELADALLEILSSLELRKRLEASGRATYDAFFTREKRVAAWVECYDTILGSTRDSVRIDLTRR